MQAKACWPLLVPAVAFCAQEFKGPAVGAVLYFKSMSRPFTVWRVVQRADSRQKLAARAGVPPDKLFHGGVMLASTIVSYLS